MGKDGIRWREDTGEYEFGENQEKKKGVYG